MNNDWRLHEALKAVKEGKPSDEDINTIIDSFKRRSVKIDGHTYYYDDIIRWGEVTRMIAKNRGLEGFSFEMD